MSRETELAAAVHSRARRLAAHLRRRWLAAQLRLRALGPVQRRLIDVVVAAAAIACILPLLILAALAIKLGSRGPILFAQERVGLRGTRFRLLKLRTMRCGAEAEKLRLAESVPEAMNGVRFKIKNDPRITFVGRLLRKFSIDELPQLWNVLTGDMTLIGPRPALWSEVVRYDARALRRLEVKPGLTCLWQVRGRSDLSFDEQVRLDLEYIDSVTVMGELRIVAETVPAVLSGKGAY